MTQNSQKNVISDEKDQTIFAVTITEPTGKDTNYWCGVEMKNTLNFGQLFQLSVSNSKFSFYVHISKEKKNKERTCLSF